MTDLRQQLVGIGEIRVEIVAAHLQVDRGRRAEIENLADDVGGQERKGHPGKTLRQLDSQALHVTGGRRVTFFERDLDIPVRFTDRARVVVDRIDGRKISANVVRYGLYLSRRDDLADRFLDLGETPGGFLDA